jgi:hypothetical protein
MFGSVADLCSRVMLEKHPFEQPICSKPTGKTLYRRRTAGRGGVLSAITPPPKRTHRE